MLKYLALGDSYTIGEAVPAEERWPVQLTKLLRTQDLAVEDPEIIATTGWTTGELLAAIEQAKPGPEYQLVSLLIGVNNQYRGLDVELYRQEFMALLQQAVYFAGKKNEGVFVLSIPDYGVTPFAASKDPARIARELEEYNKIAEDICRRQNVRFYSIIEVSKKAATDSTLLAEDELHPSGEMYRQWVSQIFPHVVNQARLLQKV